MAANVMTTPNGAFVEYLNTLHNVSANNQSAITELSITNPFFVKTMVQREVGKAIKESLENKPAHIFVLTGHAGDGKTGLLFQTLRSWKVIDEGKSLGLTGIVSLPSGKKLRYVKDFSELSPNDRITCLNRAVVECSQGISTFLVANTGPLILGFEACFSSEVQNQLVEAIDSNDGQIKHYDGTPIAVINVATIDNSTFVRPFLKNLLSEDLWSPCKTCEKRDYCVIFANRCIIDQSRERVSDFITKHYVFQQEYGKKLTIRQIVAHLSYSITGGLTCQNIKNSERAKFNYLFTNSFFGYKGIHASKDAQTMKAISDVVHAKYDYKRLRADETLFIKGALTDVFTKQIATLLSEEGLRCHHSEEWQRAVRRAYMFLNIDTSETSQKHLVQDVFSVWYPRYLQLRSGQSATSGDKELIQDALQMIFTESIVGKEKEIPITMKRENGVSQSVQLVYDSIPKKKIKIEQRAVVDYSNTKRYRLYISVNGEMINTDLSLPLFDYFEEIRRGAIATNIDPMLSQGIDSLKAQIISFCESDKPEIELLTLSDDGWDSVTAEYDSGDWKIG